jgi:hypothetical protein
MRPHPTRRPGSVCVRIDRNRPTDRKAAGKQKAVLLSRKPSNLFPQVEAESPPFRRRQWPPSPRSSSSPTAGSPPGSPAGAQPSPPSLSLTPTVRITLAGSFGFLSSCDSDPPFSSGGIGAGNVADVVLGFDDLEPYMVRGTLESFQF